MFQAQKTETVNNTLKIALFQDHYDDERNKTVFSQHSKTKTDYFWSQTGLVSDHMTGHHSPHHCETCESQLMQRVTPICSFFLFKQGATLLFCINDKKGKGKGSSLV